MKRNPKSGTGLYAYLEITGILNRGSDEEIKAEKRKYWIAYRKQWKKNKRQQSKTYIILFSFQEARVISRKAAARNITPAKYIRLLALIGEDILGDVLIGQIRQEILLFSFSMEEITGENKLSESMTSRIIDATVQMEERILSILKRK